MTIKASVRKKETQITVSASRVKQINTFSFSKKTPFKPVVLWDNANPYRRHVGISLCQEVLVDVYIRYKL